jgi:ATP-dependent Clp protease ATP-binding subunit ClpC
MTSNIGSDEFNTQAEKIGFAISDKDEEKSIEDYQSIKAKVLKQLPDFFSPEFLNRIDKTIVFSPLDKKVMKGIISLQLDDLIARLSNLNITLTYDTKVVQKILDETYNPEYGARPVRRYIQDSLEDAIADSMLTQKNKKHLTLTVEKKELKFSWK